MAQPPILRTGSPPMRGSTNRGFASTDPERQRDFTVRRKQGDADNTTEPPPEEAHQGAADSQAQQRRRS